jgi:hypothetical protein
MVTEAEALVDAEEGQDAPPQEPQPKKDDEDVLLKKAIEVLTKGKTAAGAQVASRPDALNTKNPLTTQQ